MVDKAVFASARDLDDLALDALDALGLGPAAQEAGIERGVEMHGVVDRSRARRRREAVLARRHRLETILGMVAASARRHMPQPEMVEVDPRHLDAEIAEGVEIAVVRTTPALELDAELDRSVGLAEELAGIDAQIAVEVEDRRDGCLADADRADDLGFDQLDFHRAARDVRQRGGGHPAGRAAPDNQNTLQWGRDHRA